MSQGLIHLHNFMRWVLLAATLVTLVRSLMGMMNNQSFNKGHRTSALLMMISADLQLLLGFALYFMNGWSQTLSMEGTMANKVSRYWAVEHMAGMLLGIVLIHVGYSAAKKNIPDAAKHKKLFIFTLIAIIIILASVPWPSREIGIARPLFPGMK